jgi:hypothetical protein
MAPSGPLTRARPAAAQLALEQRRPHRPLSPEAKILFACVHQDFGSHRRARRASARQALPLCSLAPLCSGTTRLVLDCLAPGIHPHGLHAAGTAPAHCGRPAGRALRRQAPALPAAPSLRRAWPGAPPVPTRTPPLARAKALAAAAAAAAPGSAAIFARRPGKAPLRARRVSAPRSCCNCVFCRHLRQSRTQG